MRSTIQQNPAVESAPGATRGDTGRIAPEPARGGVPPRRQLDLESFWHDAWAPSTVETSYEVTRVEGQIPPELHGTLFRNGPSQKILPPEGYAPLHLFDGDGLVHALRFDGGKLSYRGRFVESPSFVVEQEEGRYCMDGVGVKAVEPTERARREQHNTNVVWHAGKLLALVENAWPFRIDPRTLGPIGRDDLGAPMLGMSVTAHPKIDGRTGQMVIHGYSPFPPYAQLYVVEPDGTCSLAEEIPDVPFASMMHDVAITERFVVLPCCPIVIDGERLLGGGTFGEAVTWQPERGLWFGVRERTPGAKMRWFRSPVPGFLFHPGNAYEEGDRILMDACTYPDGGALLSSLADWRRLGPAAGGLAAVPFLYELDLGTGACSARQLDDRGAEFPRIDDRLVGQRNRWGYAVRTSSGPRSPASTTPWATIVKYDRTGGRSQAHDLGPWQWVGEPVFVPRNPGAAEDDGFVLAVGYDGPSDRSYVAVLDAGHLAGRPLAKAWLEHRVPQGFHGNFAPGVV